VRLAIPVTLPLNPAPERDDDLAQWLAAAKAGDLAAFERILVRYEPMVLRTSYRLLGNREDAQDAAQEVFLKLFRYLKRIDETRDPAAWLYRVTVNECNDARRRRRESPLDDASEPTLFEDTADRLIRETRCSAACVRCRRRNARPWCCAISKACRPAKWQRRWERQKLRCGLT
jgi:RNA polymerase sigma factor (sigma-70 family)